MSQVQQQEQDSTVLRPSVSYQKKRVLVVDIKMRDMNGFELYDEIRKIDNDIEVCFLTAATEYYDKYKQRYSSKKKEFFITKPVSLKDLANTINSILS